MIQDKHSLTKVRQICDLIEGSSGIDRKTWKLSLKHLFPKIDVSRKAVEDLMVSEFEATVLIQYFFVRKTKAIGKPRNSRPTEADLRAYFEENDEKTAELQEYLVLLSSSLIPSKKIAEEKLDALPKKVQPISKSSQQSDLVHSDHARILCSLIASEVISPNCLTSKGVDLISQSIWSYRRREFDTSRKWMTFDELKLMAAFFFHDAQEKTSPVAKRTLKNYSEEEYIVRLHRYAETEDLSRMIAEAYASAKSNNLLDVPALEKIFLDSSATHDSSETLDLPGSDREENEPGYIYFARGEYDGLPVMKIGYTSRSEVEERIREIQDEYNLKFDLEFCIVGSQREEKSIHKQYENRRVLGIVDGQGKKKRELFWLGNDLKQYVNLVRSNGRVVPRRFVSPITLLRSHYAYVSRA